jgi:arylsulfatase A-like enzyme
MTDNRRQKETRASRVWWGGAGAGVLLCLVDLLQVAWRNPGALGVSGVATLLGLYLAGALLVAGAIVIGARWRRVRGHEHAATLVAVLGGGTAAFMCEAVLRGMSPLSPWRLPAVAAIVFTTATIFVVGARRLRGVALPRFLAPIVGVVFLTAALGAARGFDVGRHVAPAVGAQRATPERPNVVLLVIDTLRADHLGCYGYFRPTSPAIDAFARDAVLFEHAYSQSSWTKPATASLLTSRYPSMHQMWREEGRLADSETTLAEALRAGGYATALLSGNPWVSPEYGFDQGVDHFVSVYDERFARVTLLMNVLKRMNLAIDRQARAYNHLKMLVQGELSTTARDERLDAAAFPWLEANKDRPFFLYMQYMSPHHPYDPPPPYDRFVPDRSITPVTWYPKKSYFVFEHGEPLSEPQRQDMIARYDGDILFADTMVGRLLEELRRLDLLERTVVIITADHGEEFYDHQNWGHGQSVYDELIHVPLIVRLPGEAPRGRRITQPVMSVDLMPTLLALTRTAPPADLAGRSLVPALRGGDSMPASEAYSELIYTYGGARALVEDHEKLVTKTQSEETRRELYDVAADPHEQQDLVARRRADGDALAGRMAAVQTWAGQRVAQATDAHVGVETTDRLKALGYVQ